MAAPNIEMIAASLRSCSLAGGDGSGGDHSPPRPQQLAEASDESTGGITVELNSDTALPFHWEQRLDIRTGEIYYINWETGVRTTDDPRAAAVAVAFSSTDYYYFDDDDDDNAVSDEYSRVGTGDEDDYEGGEDEEDDDDDTADSSSISSASPAEDHDGGGPVLVAAGCKACFMYFMVPKQVDACPKCGCALLHLGRNGCF